MYQPNIKEVHIRNLYKEAKELGIYMTTLINQILDKHYEHNHKETQF